jgi:hypothetical protein
VDKTWIRFHVTGNVARRTFKTSIKVMVVIVRSKEMVISVTVTVTYRCSEPPKRDIEEFVQGNGNKGRGNRGNGNEEMGTKETEKARASGKSILI